MDKHEDETSRKWQERGEKMQETGEKMQRLGCLLTVLLTIPIVLTIFLGPLGLGLGIIIAILFLAGSKNR